jgi:hypothetical protein
MNTTKRGCVVIGTLGDDRQAHKALSELRNAGFGSDQTGLAVDVGDLIVQADTLARADVADYGLTNALVGMGVAEHDARSYEREFAACRTVVTVQTVDRLSEAAQILRRNRARAVHRW